MQLIFVIKDFLLFSSREVRLVIACQDRQFRSIVSGNVSCANGNIKLPAQQSLFQQPANILRADDNEKIEAYTDPREKLVVFMYVSGGT